MKIKVKWLGIILILFGATALFSIGVNSLKGTSWTCTLSDGYSTLEMTLKFTSNEKCTMIIYSPATGEKETGYGEYEIDDNFVILYGFGTYEDVLEISGNKLISGNGTDSLIFYKNR